MNEEIEKLKQINDKLYFALCAMVDANNGVAVMPTPKAKKQNRALKQAEDAIADVRGGGPAEYCCKCRVMLPAYGHDAICQKCDMMQEIYKQDEVIAELLGALKAIIADDMGDHKTAQEFGGFVLPDELRQQAVAAIAKEEQRIK
jgi:hypothetical protein